MLKLVSLEEQTAGDADEITVNEEELTSDVEEIEGMEKKWSLMEKKALDYEEEIKVDEEERVPHL